MANDKLLTIRIGGAHFSLCLYDVSSKKLLPDTFQAVPISFKAGKQTIVDVWRTAVEAIPGHLKPQIAGCAIAAPWVFDADANNSREDNKYHNFLNFDLKVFFSALLGLKAGDIGVYSNATCFLRGELADGKTAAEHGIIGVSIGTDFCAAIGEGNAIHNLNWESAPFLQGTANDYLSTRWILARYFSLSKLSLVNVQQLADMRATNYTARAVLGEYLGNLSAFLSAKIDAASMARIIIGGDVAYAPGIRETLNSALSPVKITLSKQHPLSLHLGAALFYTEDQVS